MTVLLFLDSAANLLTPLIVGYLTSAILGQQSGGFLTFEELLLAWAALIILQAGLGYFSSQKLGTAAADIGANLRIRIYEHIQTLPVVFFNNREHGDILSLLSEDIQRISHFLTNTTTQLGPHILTVLGATFVVMSIDPLTGIGALCVMPLVLVVIKGTGKAAYPLSRALADKKAEHTSITEENLRLNSLIKAFNRETRELDRYNTSNQELLDSEVQHLRANNRVQPAVEAITGLAVIGLVWIGAERIHAGNLLPGELVSLIFYGFLLFRPLHAIGASYSSYQSAKGAADRLNEILRLQPEPLQLDCLPFSEPKSGIRVDNISFSYPGRTNTFDNFNAFFDAGKTTALLGPNGSGKTTLAHLLLRFFETQHGQIWIDDTAIRDISLNELRRKVGYVPQHVTLVNGTIEENIRYGLPEATPDALSKAANEALVTSFAQTLPSGLKTLVGPNGVKLSGGQKQRISLARALLKNAPIIILDEPTAMFDPESEQELLRTLLASLQGKTVIMITHRDAMLELADNVISLQEKHFTKDTSTDNPPV